MASANEIIVTFPGGRRTAAQVGQHVLYTDQPVTAGGEDTAPSPFSLFLASLASCVGFYVVSFCQKRGLSTEGIRIIQDAQKNPETGVLAKVDIRIQTPATFPAKYVEALVRVADQCAVKRAIQAQPEITCHVAVAEGARVAHEAQPEQWS